MRRKRDHGHPCAVNDTERVTKIFFSRGKGRITGKKEVSVMKGRIYDKLCAIDDTGRVNALASEPTVFCAQCGAEAHDPLSVCEPVDIQSRK